ncbi:MAG: methylmalonyl-CoA mutase subunit beta, partial [Pseudomonadota bacterium]
MMQGDELNLAEGFAEPNLQAWRAAVDKVLKGADFERRMVTRSEDGFAIQPLYTPADAEESGVPGNAPFVRGTRPADGRWLIEQRHAHPDPALANRQGLDDLARGVEGLRLVVADPLADTAEGIRLAGAGDLEVVLDGVFTGMAAVSLEAGSRAVAFGDGLLRLWADRGDAADAIVGDLHVDPIATLGLTGKLDRSVDDAFADAAGLIDRADGFPKVRVLGVDLRAYHDGGATAGEELACGLAHLAEALRALDRAGVDPSRAAAATTLTLAVDDDVFTTIAKVRALRRCWSTLVGALGADVPAPRVVAETSRRMLTKRDPWVNLLRNTVAAFGGGVAGADVLTVLPFSHALGLPDRTARRMARNTQLVLLEESSLGNVVDPAGGSWYVEHLTDEIAHAAWQRFQTIETEGGLLAALQSGGLHARLAEERAAREKAVATRKRPITGVSTFPLLDETAVEVETVDATGLPPLPTASAAVEVTPLPRYRLAESFEALRDAADRLPERPAVVLLTLGTLAEFNARSTAAASAKGSLGAAAMPPASIKLAIQVER